MADATNKTADTFILSLLTDVGGGVDDITGTIKENGLCQVQVLEEAVCNSFYAKALGKDMYPSLLSTMSNVVGQNRLSDLGWATGHGEESTEFKT